MPGAVMPSSLVTSMSFFLGIRVAKIVISVEGGSISIGELSFKLSLYYGFGENFAGSN